MPLNLNKQQMIRLGNLAKKFAESHPVELKQNKKIQSKGENNEKEPGSNEGTSN